MRKRRSASEIEFDETRLKSKPTIAHRSKHAFLSVVLGILLVELIYINPFMTKGFGLVGILVIQYYDHPLFIAFVLGCALLGWIKGGTLLIPYKRRLTCGNFGSS
jgi:hypothetical protein